MRQTGRGVVQMESGVVGLVTFRPDGTYQVDEILQKSALAGPTLRDVHWLLLRLEATDMGGGKANYRRLDLT